MLSSQEKSIWRSIARELKMDIREIVDISLRPGDNREEIYKASYRVQRNLHNLLEGKARAGEAVWASFLGKLGLTNKPVRFMYEGAEAGKTEPPKLEVHKVRPVYRVGREGKILEQILITLTQTLHFRSGPLEGAKFRGGCTLILNMSGDYDVEYIIYKNIQSAHRFKNQMDYQTGKSDGITALTDSMYEDDGAFSNINIAHLHSHAF